jgi:hypothetical protein
MDNIKKTISFWSGTIAFSISIYGLISNRKIFTLLGVSFFALSAVLAFRLLEIKRQTKKTNIVIDGKRIDALNVANLTKKPNKSLKIQEGTHFTRVEGNNLSLYFEYSGYCKNRKGENGFVFSVGGDVNIPFDKLVCYGFDLLNDPHKTHKIKPFLIKHDGLTKKLKLPFNNSLSKDDQFHIALFCELPRCIKLGKDYITATLFYKDALKIKRFSVFLEFVRNHPKWVRIYDVTSGDPRLIKDLRPKYQQGVSVYYEDKYKNIESEKALVYFFER